MNYRNLSQMQRIQAERYGPAIALRYRSQGLYHDVTWERYREMTEACALALIDAGIRPGDRVGLLAENRYEWLVADMAILAAGAVNVPPHAPMTAAQILFQFADTEIRWLFISTMDQLRKIEPILSQLPNLVGVVLMASGGRQSPEGSLGGLSSPARPAPLSWQGFLQRGRLVCQRLLGELLEREAQLGLDDLATIMYTSGTTGTPKGVMLTHGNLLSNAASLHEGARGDGFYFSWLPYSHIYARTVDHYECQLAATPLCLAESAETLVRDIGEIQPSYLASVPRFYEKCLSLAADADPAKTGQRLRAIYGPNIESLSSGGAPLPVAVAEAFRNAGLLLLQGYGLTESSPAISFNNKNSFSLSTVGPPLPGVLVKIAPDGEVLTRGPHVMKGYWKNPQATAEAIRDGWLHTGDLGRLDEQGFLSITGRKKEMLVLSSGKKISPSQVEGLLLSDPCIDQAIVFGDGRHFLSALIVPNWGNVCKHLGESADVAPEILATKPAVRDLLAQRIEQALANLAQWERVKKFVILSRPFSVAEEELTVSLKMRREVIFAHHRDEIDSLY